MKTIDKTTIQNYAGNQLVSDQGYDLFCNDAVQSIKLKDCQDGTYELEGEIADSKNNVYHTSAVIAPWSENVIINSKCNCKGSAECSGVCKHIVALLFEYNYQYEDVEIQDSYLRMPWLEDIMEDWQEEEAEQPDQSRMQEQPAADKIVRRQAASCASDLELKNLVEYYVLQERNEICRDYVNGDVDLMPILHLEAEREALELKIGISQMYVVKDIGSLVNHIKQMSHVRYGKNLEFVHSQSAFTKEAIEIVNLLFEMDQEDVFSFQYYGWGHTGSQTRRFCTLEPAMLERLIELYEGKSLHIKDHLTDMEMDVLVVRSNPPLPIQITGISKEGSQGAQIEMESIFLAQGVRQWFVLWNQCLYICSREYYEQTKSFLKLMAQVRKEAVDYGYYGRFVHWYRDNKKTSFFLSEQDFGAFSNHVLPFISDKMDVQIKNVEFAAYEPQEAFFQCFLDKVGEFIECKAKVQYGKQEYYLAKIPSKEEAVRDIRKEYQVRTLLETYFTVQKDHTIYQSKDEDSMLEFLETGIKELEKVAEIFATDRFKNMRVIQMPKVTTGIQIKGNLLDVSWNVEGMSAQEVIDILADFHKKKKYHKLNTNEFLRLDNNSLAVLQELNAGLHLSKEQLKNCRAKVPLFRSLYLDTLMKENAAYIHMERDKQFKAIVREIRSTEDGEYEIPKQIHAQLRPYQELGFQWLCTLAKYGFGGILADDMGLGKTLQVLTMLAAHQGTHTLVVCPSSLVYNWEAECQRFYPDAQIQTIIGTAAVRKMHIQEWDKLDILITSYELLKRDIDDYIDKQFDFVILDEAQYIKNASTQAAKAAKAIACTCRFALTGTPVENRLGELWSIFEFLMPGYLFSYQRFKDELEVPIAESQDEKARMRLMRMVKPFILRRLKKDVLKELPEKIEDVIYARMEGEQNRIYQAREKQLLQMLAKQTEEEFKMKKLQILAELTALRQICCDPALVYENYTQDSAKTKTCIEVIENAVNGGHKILLFSQFASMLERLAEILAARGIQTFLLTGRTNKENRRRLVAKFQEGEADVFLISLKAGGTGLNLTAADVVIHYDPWWNLAAQNQATDRAYRIGQDNKVTVFRLIMKGTIEERILKMQKDKQNLADSIISEEGVSMAGLDKKQLLAVLDV